MTAWQPPSNLAALSQPLSQLPHDCFINSMFIFVLEVLMLNLLYQHWFPLPYAQSQMLDGENLFQIVITCRVFYYCIVLSYYFIQ